MTKFYFDKEAASKSINFIEIFCSHTKGELSGTPLLLEDWQKKIVGDLFGWKNKDGTRKFRTALIQLPRKNGKTTLASSIALLMLFMDKERGSEIYCAASDRAQSGLVFEIAKGMILNNKELTSRAKVFRNSITNESKGNFFQAISSDSNTKHGFNSNCVIYDELHTAKNRDLWDTLTTSTGSRKEPLVIAITTSGYDRQSICYEIYNYAKQVKEGIIEDESFYSAIYEAETDCDITDPEVWKKANPNYGISLRKEYMKREAQRAMDVPSYQNTFKRLMLNIWTDSHQAWIGHKEWEVCKGKIDLEKLKGKECWGGLDLASTRDISCLCLIFNEDNKFIVVPYFFIPEENAKKRSDRDKVDYVTWLKQGHILGTTGDVADYNFIKSKILDLGDMFRIQSICYDRWGASQLVIDLTNEHNVPMEPMGQGFRSMNQPTKELEKLIIGQQITHDGNPVMSWMLSNITLQEDPAGNIKPNKAKSTEKIDGVVALIMALGSYMTEENISSVYDQRDLLLL